MTVNLKDFRAVLGLAEALGAQLRLWFDGPGNPLVAEPHFPHMQGQARGAGWRGRWGSWRACCRAASACVGG